MTNNFKNTKIIFQLSSPRSGSTLLAKILDSSNNLCLINEPYTKGQFLFREKKISIRHIHDAFRFTFFFIKNKQLRFLFFLWIKISNHLLNKIGCDNTLFSKIYHVNSLNQSLWKNFYNSINGKKELKFILLKCIRLKKAVELSREIDSKKIEIIHLVRHPLEVIDSQIRQRHLNLNTEIIGDLTEYISAYPTHKSFILKYYKPNCSVTQLALNWTLSNNYVHNKFRNKQNYHVITYEKLCSNEFKRSFHEQLKLDLNIPRQINFSIKSKNKSNDRNIFKQQKYSFNSDLIKKYAKYNLKPIFDESVFRQILNI